LSFPCLDVASKLPGIAMLNLDIHTTPLWPKTLGRWNRTYKTSPSCLKGSCGMDAIA
jgi:hypothetical protein